MSYLRLIPEAPRSFPIALAALAYAGRLHAGQRRQSDGAPFILHPLEVAGLLYHDGAPDHVIAAGFLHDAIEKTDANAEDLETRFGIPIATLVLAVSEDQRIIDLAKRKAALCEQVARANPDALSVFAADKISKVRELRLGTPGRRPRLVRGSRSRGRTLAHYRRCLRLLEELMTDSALVTELRTELEKPPLTAPPPAATPQHLNRAM
jgi:(p)ppGpp synthase/HD superfamily hydrolase